MAQKDADKKWNVSHVNKSKMCLSTPYDNDDDGPSVQPSRSSKDKNESNWRGTSTKTNTTTFPRPSRWIFWHRQFRRAHTYHMSSICRQKIGKHLIFSRMDMENSRMVVLAHVPFAKQVLLHLNSVFYEWMAHTASRCTEKRDATEFRARF